MVLTFGVIAGKDDVITGVAPNAQLAIMKIFSDIEDTARTSWILGALEDCVVLEVPRRGCAPLRRV